MVPREQVYEAIDSEREYQVSKWGPRGENARIECWILWMEEHLSRARTASMCLPEGEALDNALAAVRKVTALGVACMEDLGAPKRV